MHRATKRVYASIGSNIDRERHVRAAIDALRRRYAPLTISPVYETAAVGFNGAAFYNLVIGFDSATPPYRLTAHFHRVEAENGRRRGPSRYASRTLDIDLLIWGDTVLDTGTLRLPRAEILEHAFVLRPLRDIAGGERHPVDGRSYEQLWQEFGSAPEMKVIPLELGSP